MNGTNLEDLTFETDSHRHNFVAFRFIPGVSSSSPSANKDIKPSV